MKKQTKLFGTQSIGFCAIALGVALGALFVLALAACGNGTTSPPPPAGKPALTGTVAITGGTEGIFNIDDVVTAEVTGSNATAFNYQWQECETRTGAFADISDATGNEYTITADTKTYIRVIVTAEGFTGSLTSNAERIGEKLEYYEYASISFINAEGENIWNPVRVGDTIGVDTSNILDANEDDIEGPFNYQWQWTDDEYAETDDDFTDINGATGATYTVTSAVSGQYIRVVVTHPDYNGSIKSMYPIKVRESNPVVTSVTIEGKDDNGKITMSRGTSLYLFATVDGTDLEEYVDTDVTWTKTGSTNAGTSIDYGYLTVAVNETADELEITATSVTDPTKSDTVTVTLTDYAGKTLVITGLSGQSGNVMVQIMETLDLAGYEFVCSGEGIIEDGTVTLALFDGLAYAPWEGSGEYYIKLTGLNYGYDTYVYTNGANLNTTALNANATYEFEDGTTDFEISFDKFKLVLYGEGGYTITITGLSEFDGAIAEVELLDIGLFDFVATGYAVISGGTVTISLAEVDPEYGSRMLDGWMADDGDHFINLRIVNGPEWTDTSQYVYVGNDNLADLEIETWSDYFDSALKGTFTGTSSSFAFDEFESSDGIDYDW
jgi:hypothetical protein